ncbi:hypothetical protein ACHAW5_004048 [Stephanodiscus triporus]|uniref:PS II complex 12 kDa extrinsic protein n=1 Tax=Stephanodiscus triporus TaxID=2934178 RepID=A0ABD3Q3W5_9STRA
MNVRDDDRDDDGVRDRCRSRSEFLAAALSSASAFAILPAASYASDDTTTTTTTTTARAVHSIGRCEVDDDCVSTANIRDAKGSYSPDEAFARIKGVLASDNSYAITEVDDDARHVRAYAASDNARRRRGRVPSQGRRQGGPISPTARRNGSVYEGGGVASRGNGPLGQLMFYGLQSGQGFEAVFEDDE